MSSSRVLGRATPLALAHRLAKLVYNEIFVAWPIAAPGACLTGANVDFRNCSARSVLNADREHQHEEVHTMAVNHLATPIRCDRAARWPVSCWAVVCLFSSVAVGQVVQAPALTDPAAAVLTPPQTHYMGREIAQTMHYFGAPWLIRESRQREEDCATMLTELRLRPGMTACDMGCGNGFYTLKMAEAVGPDGTVWAVDIQPEMLRLMQARADEAGIQNIRATLGTLVDPRLPENSLDLILCVDVYHEFSHPEAMLAAMRRALRPDGVVVLVEFREEDPEVPIKPLHKMSKAQISKEWLPNGFRVSRQFDQLPWQHMIFFARASAESAGTPTDR